MRNWFLILSLILSLNLGCFAQDVGEFSVSNSYYTSSYNLLRRHNNLSRPFWARRNLNNRGVITGFTPPINSNFTNNNYPSINTGFNSRFKRVLNPNYYNVYRNNPAYAPYTNPNLGNFNTLNNGRYVPLFRGTNNGGLNGNFQGLNNGIFNDGASNSNTGATVTIID